MLRVCMRPFSKAPHNPVQLCTLTVHTHTMQILFIADPLESFKIYKDTTFAMMREAQRRGHTLAVCEPRHVSWVRGGQVSAQVRHITLTGETDSWFAVQSDGIAALAGFDAVLMRKDPPFDSEYFYATHMLEQAEREGARVFNKPRALRDHPEKLAIMEFPQFIAPPSSLGMPQKSRNSMRNTATSF